MRNMFILFFSAGAMLLSFYFLFTLYTESNRLIPLLGNNFYLTVLLIGLTIVSLAVQIILYLNKNRLAIQYARATAALFVILQIFRKSFRPLNAEDILISIFGLTVLFSISLFMEYQLKPAKK